MHPSQNSVDLLSGLLLPPKAPFADAAARLNQLEQNILQISKVDFDCLSALAATNHVVMRGLDVFRQITLRAGDQMRAGWASDCLTSERARINNAISFL